MGGHIRHEIQESLNAARAKAAGIHFMHGVAACLEALLQRT